MGASLRLTRSLRNGLIVGQLRETDDQSDGILRHPYEAKIP